MIPLPLAVATQIDNYLAVRNRLSPEDQNPFLLAGKDQNPLKDYQVRSLFHQGIQDIGLEQQRRVMGNMNFNPPVPHSLRHSFAINTLRQIKERGQSPQNALPILAAYLGHRNYRCTSVYLRIADAQSRKNLYDFTIWQEWRI